MTTKEWSVCGDLGGEGSRLRGQPRYHGGDAPRMPSTVSGWQVLNSVVSDEEFDEGGMGFCWDRTPGQGLHGPPAVARDSKLLVPALPTPGGPLPRMSEGPKPHLEPPRPGGALPGRSLPWSPHSHMEPCSRIRAGLLNETICLAFLTWLGLVRPSISPVRILVCLSPLPGPATRPGSEGGHGRFGLWLSCLFFSSGHSWSPC